MYKAIYTVFFALSLLLNASASFADTSLNGAQACTRHLSRMERLYNIPSHWLSAIASTESGRYHSGIGLSIPWPWTINVKGQGYWFKTKQEAMTAVRKFQRKGISSIDVGCMQVNLHYHGHHFSSLDQAFDPVYNIAYAAKFLRDNYDELRSWRRATAAYHSRTPDRGANYYRKVYKKWQQVLDRLNDNLFEVAVTRGTRSLQYGNARDGETGYYDGDRPFKLASEAGRRGGGPVKLTTAGTRPTAITTLQKAKDNGVLVIRVQKPGAAQIASATAISASTENDTKKAETAAVQEKKAPPVKLKAFRTATPTRMNSITVSRPAQTAAAEPAKTKFIF